MSSLLLIDSVCEYRPLRWKKQRCLSDRGCPDYKIGDVCDFYRPHPKDGGRYCFQFVSSHLDWGGGYPIPGLDWGVPHPRSGLGGTPSQVQVRVGVPYLADRGVPPSKIRMGVPWDTPIKTGWGYLPAQD